MANGALEPEAVARAKRMALELVEPELERPLKDVDELLALM